MTRIIIQNVTVLTLDDSDTFYYPGFIEITDDKIIALGEWSEDRDVISQGDAIVIDGTDKLVMPGLIDLHFHTSVAKVSIFSQDSPST